MFVPSAGRSRTVTCRIRRVYTRWRSDRGLSLVFGVGLLVLLANQDVYGFDAAARMITQGRVMVVLDGLDEMSAELLPEALDARGGAGDRTR